MNQSFKATKTAVALAVLGLVSGAAFADETPTIIQGSMSNVTIEAGKTGTIKAPEGINAELTTTVDGLTLAGSASGHVATVTASKAVNLNLSGTSNFGKDSELTLGSSKGKPATGSKLTLLGGSIVNNSGFITADEIELNGTLNTGLFGTSNHVKFNELTLNEGGLLNIETIDKTKLAGGKTTGLALTFTDGTLNFNGGQFNVGNAGKLTVGEGEDVATYDFTTNGKLNVAVTAKTGNAAANFKAGNYEFGNVTVDAGDTHSANMTLKGANVSVLDLTLGGKSTAGTVTAKLTKGSVDVNLSFR